MMVPCHKWFNMKAYMLLNREMLKTVMIDERTFILRAMCKLNGILGVNT